MSSKSLSEYRHKEVGGGIKILQLCGGSIDDNTLIFIKHCQVAGERKEMVQQKRKDFTLYLKNKHYHYCGCRRNFQKTKKKKFLNALRAGRIKGHYSGLIMQNSKKKKIS